MSARELAAAARFRLTSAGVPDAAFEAEFLVRSASGLSRAEFFARKHIVESDASRAGALIERRIAREPASYITGSREFWGLDFEVGPGVLVPRPETELLVETALAEARGATNPVIIDVGTGSGCIAIALACELGGRAPIVAIDISTKALGYARRNATRHRAHIGGLAGNLCEAVPRADIVLANLPYIPTGEIDRLEPEVNHWEPRLALDGGSDGLALIRRLVHDCGDRLRPRLLALEVGFGMAPATAALASACGARVEILKDLSGIDRVVCCRWR